MQECLNFIIEILHVTSKSHTEASCTSGGKNCPMLKADMKRISKNNEVEFAVILTDYFGGTGEQFANVFKGDKNVNLEIRNISNALKYLGVEKGNHHDEFDAVGLVNYRSNPNYLDKYREIADELGV